MSKFADPNPLDAQGFGEKFFSTPYKLKLGMWIVHQEIGVPFNAAEAAEAFRESRVMHKNALVTRFMPVFVESSLVASAGRYGPGVFHQWARIENDWWKVFEVANKIAEQNQST